MDSLTRCGLYINYVVIFEQCEATYTHNVVESPEIGEPAIAGCEVDDAQMRGVVPSLLLEHGTSNAEPGGRLLLVPFVNGPVDLLVSRVPEPLACPDGRVVPSHELPFAHVPLLLGKSVEDLGFSASELRRQLK